MRESPGYGTNLPVSHTGHQISLLSFSVIKFFTDKDYFVKVNFDGLHSLKTLYNVHSHTHVIFWGLRQFVNIGGGGVVVDILQGSM